MRDTLRLSRLVLVLAAALCLIGCQTKTAEVEKIEKLGGRVTATGSNLEVTLTDWKGTADDYALLKGLKNVTVLNMANPDVTNATLENVAALTTLEDLDVHNTKIDDDGIKHLTGLKHLKKLNLKKTAVTAPGLEPLKALPALEFVDVRDTKVPAEEVKLWKNLRK